MRIAEKLARCANSDWEQSAVSIAFLGDSVTQGCFEMYCKENGNPETVFEPEHAYHRYVARILSVPYIIERQIQGFMRIAISQFDTLQQKRCFSHPFRSKDTDQPPVPLDLSG